MSKKGLIVALVIAAVLAVVTAVVMKGGGKTTTTSGTLTGLTASELMAKVSGGSIDVLRPDGTSDVLLSANWPDGWLLYLKDGKEKLAAWSVDPARVRACMRVLAETVPLGNAPEQNDATTVIIYDRGLKGIVLSFGTSTLGGRTGVEIGTRPGSKSVFVPSEVAAMFTPESFRAWRETRVFSTAAGTHSRISDGRLSLARVGSSWSLTSPIAAAADERAVAALLAALDGIAFKQLDLVPAAEWTGDMTETPPWLAVETDLDPATAQKTGFDVAEQKLYVGAGGKAYCTTTLRSRAGKTGEFRGSASGLVDAGVLKALVKDPMTLVSKVASRRAAADVSAVRIGKAGAGMVKREYVREVDKWIGADGAAVGPTDSAGIAAVITVACRTAAAVASLTPPAGAKALASVQVTGRDVPQDVWLTAYSAPGPRQPDGAAGREVLLVHDGVVWRVYGPGELAAVGAWLSAAAE